MSPPCGTPQQGNKKLKPVSPSQCFQQELSSWGTGKGIKISCFEAGGEEDRGVHVW